VNVWYIKLAVRKLFSAVRTLKTYCVVSYRKNQLADARCTGPIWFPEIRCRPRLPVIILFRYKTGNRKPVGKQLLNLLTKQSTKINPALID